MTKIVTLTGLKQASDLPHGTKCTPVEDMTMAGDKVIRCKEDVVKLEAAAPEKVATLAGVGRVKKPRRRKARQTDKPCVPEWVAMRSRGGRQVKRCHCRHGKFLKSSACSSRKD